MATSEKKASVKKVKAPKERKHREISIGEDLEIPPMVKESKYPWAELGKAEPKEKYFFVGCENQEEADTLRSSVYSSGRNYFLKRKIARIPIVRVMETDGRWGVAAWCGVEE
jgi:hypothetical protein